MWKSFTDVSRGAGALACVALIGGCAALAPGGEGARAAREDAPVDDPSTPTVSESVVTAVDPMPHAPAVHVAATSQQLFDDALAAMQVGGWQRAVALLETLTTTQPELSGAWVNLGQAYSELGQEDKARDAYLAAVEANPNNCVALNLLGVHARKAGDFQAAGDYYRACISRVPDYKDTYLNLGILYELYLGKLPEALVYYRRYQALGGQDDRRVAGWVVDLERRLDR